MSKELPSKPSIRVPLRTVLVVESSVELRGRLVFLLEDLPDIVVTAQAESADQALERLHERSFDAVVLDVDLAARDGLEALRRIRREAPYSALIALSSHSDPEIRERCLRLGADFFFVTFLEFERIRDALLASSRKGIG